MPQLSPSQKGVFVPCGARVRSVFLRGSHVRFMVLPDILKNAPFFKKIETKQAKAAAAKTSKAKQAAQQREELWVDSR